MNITINNGPMIGGTPAQFVPPIVQENARLIRLMLRVPPAQDIDGYNAQIGRLAALGLDAGTIAARAALLSENRSDVDEEAATEAGLDPETTKFRHAFLATRSLPDPALALVVRQTQNTSIDEPRSVGELSIEDERCLEALARFERGEPQGKLAEHYNRSTRTVRTWLQRAKAIRVERFHRDTPSEVLATQTAEFEGMVVELKKRLDEALARNAVTTAIELSREIRAWHRQKIETLRLVGFFNHFEHPAVAASRLANELNGITGM